MTTNKYKVSPEQREAAKADRDTIHRFIFTDKPAQGLWLNVNKALTDSLAKQHHYPVAVRKLLGELMLVGSLFRHYMKAGELSLSIRSQGYAVNTLLVSVDEHSVRAVARLDENFNISDDAKLEDLVDVDANLILSVFNQNAQPYQSIIRVNLNSITESVLDFYKQSVQIPVFLRMANEVLEDGSINTSALFMQYIADGSGTVEEFEDLAKLAQTVEDQELLNLSAFDVLYRLFNQENVKEELCQHLEFKCTCSREKMLNGLASLGLAEVESYLEELKQDHLEMKCECCGNAYDFTLEDVKQNLEEHPDSEGVFINRD